MFRAVFLQIGATLLAAMLAGAVLKTSALSVFLGGFACILPNLLFALYLRFRCAMPAFFFIGEGIKVLLTIGLLVLIVIGYRDVHCLALFVGMVVALQAPLFIFMFKS